MHPFGPSISGGHPPNHPPINLTAPLLLSLHFLYLFAYTTTTSPRKTHTHPPDRKEERAREHKKGPRKPHDTPSPQKTRIKTEPSLPQNPSYPPHFPPTPGILHIATQENTATTRAEQRVGPLCCAPPIYKSLVSPHHRARQGLAYRSWARPFHRPPANQRGRVTGRSNRAPSPPNVFHL